MAASKELTMVDSDIKNSLLEHMARMSISMQKQVLNFALSMNQPRPKGTPVSKLLRFAGTIRPEDGEEMLKAIEEGCEQVDQDGW
jgi:hypothetical protein